MQPLIAAAKMRACRRTARRGAGQSVGDADRVFADVGHCLDRALIECEPRCADVSRYLVPARGHGDVFEYLVAWPWRTRVGRLTWLSAGRAARNQDYTRLGDQCEAVGLQNLQQTRDPVGRIRFDIYDQIGRHEPARIHDLDAVGAQFLDRARHALPWFRPAASLVSKRRRGRYEQQQCQSSNQIVTPQQAIEYR